MVGQDFVMLLSLVLYEKYKLVDHTLLTGSGPGTFT